MISIQENLRNAAIDPGTALTVLLNEQQSVLMGSLSASFQGILAAIQDAEGRRRAREAYEAGLADYRAAVEKAVEQTIEPGTDEQSEEIGAQTAGQFDSQKTALAGAASSAQSIAASGAALAPATSRTGHAFETGHALAAEVLQAIQELGPGEKLAPAEAARLLQLTDEATALTDSARTFAQALATDPVEKGIPDVIAGNLEQTRQVIESATELGRDALPAAQGNFEAFEELGITMTAVDARSFALRVAERMAGVTQELAAWSASPQADPELLENLATEIDAALEAAQEHLSILQQLGGVGGDEMTAAHRAVEAGLQAQTAAGGMRDLAALSAATTGSPRVYDLKGGYRLALWESSGVVGLHGADGSGILIRPDGKVDSLDGSRKWQLHSTATFVLANQAKITINPGEATDFAVALNLATSVRIDQPPAAEPATYSETNGFQLDPQINDGHILRPGGSASEWLWEGSPVGVGQQRQSVGLTPIDHEDLPTRAGEVEISEKLSEYLASVGFDLSNYDENDNGKLTYLEYANLLNDFGQLLDTQQAAVAESIQAAADAVDRIENLLRFVDRLRRDENARTPEFEAQARQEIAETERQLLGFQSRAQALSGGALETTPLPSGLVAPPTDIAAAQRASRLLAGGGLSPRIVEVSPPDAPSRGIDGRTLPEGSATLPPEQQGGAIGTRALKNLPLALSALASVIVQLQAEPSVARSSLASLLGKVSETLEQRNLLPASALRDQLQIALPALTEGLKRLGADPDFARSNLALFQQIGRLNRELNPLSESALPASDLVAQVRALVTALRGGEANPENLVELGLLLGTIEAGLADAGPEQRLLGQELLAALRDFFAPPLPAPVPGATPSPEEVLPRLELLLQTVGQLPPPEAGTNDAQITPEAIPTDPEKTQPPTIASEQPPIGSEQPPTIASEQPPIGSKQPPVVAELNVNEVGSVPTDSQLQVEPSALDPVSPALSSGSQPERLLPVLIDSLNQLLTVPQSESTPLAPADAEGLVAGLAAAANLTAIPERDRNAISQARDLLARVASQELQLTLDLQNRLVLANAIEAIKPVRERFFVESQEESNRQNFDALRARLSASLATVLPFFVEAEDAAVLGRLAQVLETPAIERLSPAELQTALNAAASVFDRAIAEGRIEPPPFPFPLRQLQEEIDALRLALGSAQPAIPAGFAPTPNELGNVEEAERLMGRVYQQEKDLQTAATQLLEKSERTIAELIRLYETDNEIRQVIVGDDLSDEAQEAFVNQMRDFERALGIDWGLDEVSGFRPAAAGAAAPDVSTRAISSGSLL